MLCCLGLFAGSAIGTILGGPWTFIGPSVGFVVGLIGDTKLLHGFYKRHRIPAGDVMEVGMRNMRILKELLKIRFAAQV